MPTKLPKDLNRIGFVLILLLSSFTVLAQGQNQYDKGTPPQHAAGISPVGSYMSAELGNVNLSNGALNFNLPLGTIGGRGFSMPLTLNYSSKIWSAGIDTDQENPQSPIFKVAYAKFSHLTSTAGFYGQIGAGWSVGAAPSLSSKLVQISRVSQGPNIGCYTYRLTKLSLILPGNGEIEFRDDAYDGAPILSQCGGGGTGGRGYRWHASDGSAMIYISDSEIADSVSSPSLSGVVVTSDGMRYHVNAGGKCDSITDRNGNRITINYVSANEVQYVDQLGRITKLQRTIADPEYPNETLALLVTLPGYNGANRYYKIRSGVMNQYYRSDENPSLPVVNGDYDPLGIVGDHTPGGTKLFLLSYSGNYQRIDERPVLRELELPDHRYLRFKYNRFGEVAEVELPTGGKIWYQFQHSFSLPAGSSPEHETTGEHHTSVFLDRAISQRKTFANGTTLDCTWNYSYSDTFTTVTATSATGTLLLNEAHHFLPEGRYMDAPGGGPGAHDGSYYNLWSTGIEWRTEIKDAVGNVIVATEQDWTQRAPVSWSTYPAAEQPANDNRVNVQRKILDDGKVSYVSTNYDQFNNPIETSEFDFGNLLKRRTVTSYSATNLVNGENYAADSIHLLRLPLQQSIFDGANPPVEHARTVYEYDIYSGEHHESLQPYGSVTSHDTPNYGAEKTTRGNATRIGRWIKTSNTYVYSYRRYDIVGNVVSVKDGLGNVSTGSFADDFGTGSNPGSGIQGTYGPTYAFPSQMESPPPNPGEQPHAARSQYDFSTGLPTGFKDRNNVITQTIYDDPFNRPTLIKSALGISGVESHAAMYYAPRVLPEFGITLTRNDVLKVSDQASVSDKLLRSWTVTDGFGRTLESWSDDPQGDVHVATIYDALGRMVQSSNPFRPSLETPAFTTTAFDLAGRTTSVTTPDTAVVSTAYSGNRVLVTDQDLKQRLSETNALGQLKNVWEITATDAATESVAFPDHTEITAGYRTTYEYDPLDDLTKVTQGTQMPRTFAYDSLSRLTSAFNPESGTTNYQYDDNGNLLVKTDAREVSTHVSYDALNRPTRRWYNGSSLVSASGNNVPALPTGVGASHEVIYSYDAPGENNNGKGRLSSVTSSVSSYSYTSYDALGRVRTATQATKFNPAEEAQAYPMSYSYDLAGNLKTQTYPSGRVVASEYDAAGRLAGVKNQASGLYYAGAAATDSANRLQYAAHGATSQMRLGNGLWEHTNFNTRLQATQIGLGTVSTNSSLLQLDYGYGTTANNGNVLSQTITIPGLTLSQAYTYDPLNRLETANENTGVSWKQKFLYDRFGNRRIDSNPANTSPSLVGPNPVLSETSNRIVAQAGEQYLYDAAGNLTRGREGQTYEFNAENKMTSFNGGGSQGGASYSYDGDGNRVKKVVGTLTTVFVYDESGRMVAEYSSAPPEANGTRYLTSDQLGSPRVITDSSGAVKSRHDYLPFGEELFTGTGGRTTGQGYDPPPPSPGHNLRQKFTSKERDNETGLDYSINRYYSPTQGRFTSPDPLNSSGIPLLPQSWNRYSYTINNPLLYVDPKGLIWGYRDHDGIRTFTWYNNQDDLDESGDTAWSHSQYFSNQAGTDAVYLGTNGNARHISQEEYAAGVVDEFLRGPSSPLGEKEKAKLNNAFGDRIMAEHPEWNFWAGLFGGLAGGLAGSGKSAAAGAASGIDVEALTLTRTVANHLDDVSKLGVPARPYLNSRLVMREIMEAGKAVPDPGGVPGALRWDVPGAVSGTKGTWELVIDPKSSTVLHFVFKGTK